MRLSPTHPRRPRRTPGTPTVAERAALLLLLERPGGTDWIEHRGTAARLAKAEWVEAAEGGRWRVTEKGRAVVEQGGATAR